MLAGVPAVTVPALVFYLLVAPGLTVLALGGAALVLVALALVYFRLVLVLGWVLSRRGTKWSRWSTSRRRAW